MRTLLALTLLLHSGVAQAVCQPLTFLSNGPPLVYDANFDAFTTCSLLGGSVLRAPLHSGVISSATTAIDFSVTHATCTALGTPAPTFDTDGPDLDGIDQYIDCGDNDRFTLTGPMSVGIWANLDSVIAGISFVQKGRFNVDFEFGLTMSGSGFPRLIFQDSSTNGFIGREDQTSLPADTWFCLVGTYDGGGVDTGIDVYVDGAVVDDASVTGGVFTQVRNGTAELAIGYDFVPSTYLNGEVSGAQIWYRELSAADVTSWCDDLGRQTDN